jgi:hypothetical protein
VKNGSTWKVEFEGFMMFRWKKIENLSTNIDFIPQNQCIFSCSWCHIYSYMYIYVTVAHVTKYTHFLSTKNVITFEPSLIHLHQLRPRKPTIFAATESFPKAILYFECGGGVLFENMISLMFTNCLIPKTPIIVVYKLVTIILLVAKSTTWGQGQLYCSHSLKHATF